MLTSLASSPFAATGVTAVVRDSLDDLYAYGASGMTVFNISPNSGELTPIGSPVAFSGVPEQPAYFSCRRTPHSRLIRRLADEKSRFRSPCIPP